MSCFGFRPRARKTTDNLGSETLRPRLVPLRTVSNKHDFDTVLPLTESSLQAQSAISLNSETISEDLEKLLNKAEKAMVKSFLPTHAQVTWYGLCKATSQAVSDVHARLAIQHLEYLFEMKEPVTSKATDYEAGVIIATAFQAKRIFKSMSELLPWFINYQVGLVFSKLASSPNLSGKRRQVIVDWQKKLLTEVRDFAKRQDYSDTSVYQVQCELKRLEFLAKENNFYILVGYEDKRGKRKEKKVISPLFTIDSILKRLAKWQLPARYDSDNRKGKEYS